MKIDTGILAKRITDKMDTPEWLTGVINPHWIVGTLMAAAHDKGAPGTFVNRRSWGLSFSGRYCGDMFPTSLGNFVDDTGYEYTDFIPDGNKVSCGNCGRPFWDVTNPAYCPVCGASQF